jgi:hypothetical protein
MNLTDGDNVLPGVKGCRSVNFFFAIVSGVSVHVSGYVTHDRNDDATFEVKVLTIHEQGLHVNEGNDIPRIRPPQNTVVPLSWPVPR